MTDEERARWDRWIYRGMGVLVAAYAITVILIFFGRHLAIPRGSYSLASPGTYGVTNDTNYQIPSVFRSKTVALKAKKSGAFELVAPDGAILRLDQGADGLYFSENFSPVGAWLMPGIARNWNEGRLFEQNGTLVVEGWMLEKGLMLFVIPFKDATEWRVELRPISQRAPDFTDPAGGGAEPTSGQ
jgi:hypothetical protein